LKRKVYEKKLFELQVRLYELQEWVKRSGTKAIVIFEGRDAAGKGGTIRSITERVSPRVFRVVALPKPTAREQTQIYIQRYIPHLPAQGEIVLFDRSWYNRAGVEPVMGFCTPEQRDHFLAACPDFEKYLVDEGIILLKYWLEVSPAEQEARLRARIEDPRRQWKVRGIDLESRRRWYDYSLARDAMFAATDTPHAPWHIVPADNKRTARLNCISHLLSRIPHETIPQGEIVLPDRATEHEYDDQASIADRTFIPAIY
jgi:polyphosphate kinase 2